MGAERTLQFGEKLSGMHQGFGEGSIKNLQAKWEITALSSGGIQQVSPQRCDVCFVALRRARYLLRVSCARLTKKFLDFCLCCVAGLIFI